MRWMVEKTRWIECECCQNANTQTRNPEGMKAQQAHKAGVHVVCVDEAQCCTVERGDGVDAMDKHKVAPHTCTHGKQPWLCTEASSVGHTQPLCCTWHVVRKQKPNLLKQSPLMTPSNHHIIIDEDEKKEKTLHT